MTIDKIAATIKQIIVDDNGEGSVLSSNLWF